MKQETIPVALKTLPPITVSGMILWGFPLSDWVVLATGFWILLQIGFFLYDRFKKKSSTS